MQEKYIGLLGTVTDHSKIIYFTDLVPRRKLPVLQWLDVLNDARHIQGPPNIGILFDVNLCTALRTIRAVAAMAPSFEITSSGTETIFHNFNANGADGYSPTAALVLKNNTLYGTTLIGGAKTAGTVFKVVP